MFDCIFSLQSRFYTKTAVSAISVVNIWNMQHKQKHWNVEKKCSGVSFISKGAILVWSRHWLKNEIVMNIGKAFCVLQTGSCKFKMIFFLIYLVRQHTNELPLCILPSVISFCLWKVVILAYAHSRHPCYLFRKLATSRFLTSYDQRTSLLVDARNNIVKQHKKCDALMTASLYRICSRIH